MSDMLRMLLDVKVHINMAKMVYVGIKRKEEKTKAKAKLTFDSKTWPIP